MRFQKLRALAVAGLLAMTVAGQAFAGAVFYTNGNLGGGLRWTADPYSYYHAGADQYLDRSLTNGLEYSMQGGSFEAYRDMFQWDVVPSLAAFQTAIEQSFEAWRAVDPVTGLGTDLYFANVTGSVATVGSGFASVNILGAEIDLLASDSGSAGMMGTSYFQASANEVTLTSGTTNYTPGSIIGSDINMNNNVGTVYSLDWFQRILTHEIGHSLGLGDLEDAVGPGGLGFIDDNFDPNDPVATLNNSWASLVDVYDPSASLGLTQYFNLESSHLTMPGVDLLMESRGVGVGPNNPLNNPSPMTNDDYGMRQFLYPYIQKSEFPTDGVPAPAALGFLGLGLAGLGLMRRRRDR